ncbi:MAG: SCP2 sterol-binding domain-containing protein [Halobacteriota archaeon]|nr:SCP2 sterol-binding domain-containing protein [Halobacteriota archaeon]
MDDLVEFTEKIIEIVKDDEKVLKKAKKTKATLTIGLKNGDYTAFSIVIDDGKISFSREELQDADYKIEMTKQSYEDLLNEKITGMKVMKAINIVKGSLMGMRKLQPIFESLPKTAKELKASQIEMVT